MGGRAGLLPVVFAAQNAIITVRRRGRILRQQTGAASQNTAILRIRNVYAHPVRGLTSAASSTAGSLTPADVYDDSQTLTTSAEIPALHKQMLRACRSFAVNEDGPFRAEAPEDRPVFVALRGSSGVAARYPGGRPDWTERAATNLERLLLNWEQPVIAREVRCSPAGRPAPPQSR